MVQQSVHDRQLAHSPSQSEYLQELHRLGAGHLQPNQTPARASSWSQTGWLRMFDPLKQKHYYFNQKLSRVTWTPPPPDSDPDPSGPPPQCFDSDNNGIDDDNESVAAVAVLGTSSRKTICRVKKRPFSFLAPDHPGHAIDYDGVFSSESAHYHTGTDTSASSEQDTTGDNTALERTIIPNLKRNGKLVFMQADLVRIGLSCGLDLKKFTRLEQETALTVYFSEWHARDGTQYADSKCFKALKQENEKLRGKRNNVVNPILTFIF